MKYFKHSLILVIGMIFSIGVRGQSLQKLLTTDNQRMVVDAIAPAFSIIKQEFQLLDETTGQKYNLDSLSYFGYSDALCVKLKGGFLTSKRVVTPWDYDENISSYPEYKPVLSDLAEFDQKNESWNKLIHKRYSNVEEVAWSEKVIVRDTLFASKGLEIDTVEGRKEGWLIWIYRYGDRLSFKPIRQTINVSDTLRVIPVIQPVDEQDLLTGVMLSTEMTEIGVIRFRLVALVEKFAEGWNAICLLPKKAPEVEEHSLVAAPEVLVPSKVPPIEKKESLKKKK